MLWQRCETAHCQGELRGGQDGGGARRGVVYPDVLLRVSITAQTFAIYTECENPSELQYGGTPVLVRVCCTIEAEMISK